MKLAKVLLASFVLQLFIVGVGRLISWWAFGPTSPRENTLALLSGVTGILSSAIVVGALNFAVIRTVVPDVVCEGGRVGSDRPTGAA